MKNTQMGQFIRLPQSIGAADGKLGVLALAATAGWLLNNPKGYRAPAGGIKSQLRRYFKPGSRFEAAWRAFNRHYLKIVRTPVSENRFESFYELHWKSKHTDGLQFLGAAEGRQYAQCHQKYREPDSGYTKVPVALLKDKTLSPAAKGVIILALRELQLQQNKQGYFAAKASMLKQSGVKASSFEAAWKEAKASGYLYQQRLLDELTGQICWGYRVAETSEEAELNRQLLSERRVLRKSKTPAIQETEAAPYPAVCKEERMAVFSLIKENVGYDYLMNDCMTGTCGFSAEELKGCVRLITDTVCSDRSTVRIGRQEIPTELVREAMLSLRYEHVAYVLEQMKRYLPVNPTAYMQTALYNAAGQSAALLAESLAG